MYVGKIAASTGHAEWISSKMSRQRVLGIRAGSNAIIVGGNTVKRDSKWDIQFLYANKNIYDLNIRLPF